MRILIKLAPAAAALLLAMPASAADLFGGVYKHHTPFASLNTHEGGYDVQAGYRFNSILNLGPLGGLQPYVLGSVNSRGDTSFAAAGIALKLGVGPVYVRPGVGLAVHTGPSRRYYGNERTDLGSRVLYEPEVAVGFMVAPRVSVEASWTHLSHAQTFGKQNPGLDMLGARINLHLP